jgi:hypothetical protein
MANVPTGPLTKQILVTPAAGRGPRPYGLLMRGVRVRLEVVAARWDGT